MTTEADAVDTDFEAHLMKSCATKQQEWDVRCKTRSKEIAATSGTLEDGVLLDNLDPAHG